MTKIIKIFMKKILLLSFLTLVSCSYQDRKIPLNFDVKNQVSDLGEGRQIQVVVTDERSDKSLGKKQIFSKTIKINSEEEIAKIIENKVKQNLNQRGFVNGSGKKIELHIEGLKYDAQTSFIGSSKLILKLRVVIKDWKNSAIFVKTYDSTVNSKYFIAPLDMNDEKTINLALKDIVEEILSDDSFIHNLIK